MLNQPEWLYLDSIDTYFPTIEHLLNFKNRADFEQTLHQDWPVRLERSRGGGNYRCDFCGLDFKQWLTIDPEYRRMPDTLWGAVICLGCYRFICYRNGSAPEGAIQKDIDHSHLAPMSPRQDQNHQKNSRSYGQRIIRVALRKFTPKRLLAAAEARRRRNAERIRL
jgi:hypothetical protein